MGEKGGSVHGLHPVLNGKAYFNLSSRPSERWNQGFRRPFLGLIFHDLGIEKSV